jgi:hypothetical protein
MNAYEGFVGHSWGYSFSGVKPNSRGEGVEYRKYDEGEDEQGDNKRTGFFGC